MPAILLRLLSFGAAGVGLGAGASATGSKVVQWALIGASVFIVAKAAKVI